jgi:hypothetical protein
MGAPGKTTIYKLARSGRLEMFSVNGRTMISGDSLRALLNIEAVA